MDDKGVFAVARGVWEHPLLDGDPFSKREAWIWLVSAAAWKQMRVGYAGSVIRIERAEFLFSVRFLADKWKWSKSRVARFLDVLQKQDMLRDVSRDGATIYLIANYNEYQRVGLPKRDTNRDTKRDSSGTAAGQQRDKEETLKHSSIEKEESPAPVPVARPPKKTFLNGHQKDFDEFWAAYPKKEDKLDAMKAYAKALTIADAAVILEGVRHYARRQKDKQFIRGPARWLNAQSWLNEAPITESRLPDPEFERAQRENEEFIKSKGYT